MEKEVKTGTVIWFKKTMGFIAQDEGGKDMFVHYTSILTEGPTGYKTLEPGQKVSYTVGANNVGPQAENVEILGNK